VARRTLGFLQGAVNDQALRWPLLLPLALALGAAAYMTAPDEPGWWMVGLAAGVPSAAWLLVRRRGAGLLALGIAFVACAGIGALAGKVRSTLVAAPILREQIGPVRIEGIIAEIDSSERSRRVRIDVRAIEGLTPEQTPRFVRFSFKGELGFVPGRAVACRAILSPPPRPVVPGDYEFHRDAWFQQLGGVGFSIGSCAPLPTRPPSEATDAVFHWLGAVRRALAEEVYRAAGPGGGGMSAAMVSGDRSFVTPEDAEVLRLSGLAHLLSISGVHMVLVGGIIFFVVRMGWPLIEPLALRVPTPRAAAFAAIVACTLYFLISGMEVATQRAYIIALIGFGAKLFDRPAISLRSLAIALGAVVVLQPEAVVTPGFQMSFAASGALIALYEMWPRLERPERPGVFSRIAVWFVAASATSLVASLATLPFALHHFDRAALFSVIANIISTPIITLATTPAAAMAAIASPFGLAEPFLWLMGQSLDLVLTIAEWSVAISPEVDLPRLDMLGVALAAVAIGLTCVLYGRGRVFALVPAAAAIAVWLSAPQAVGYVADDGSVFLKQPESWVELKDWRGDNGLNPLIIGDVIDKSPCPGKGAACALSVEAGEVEIAPAAVPAGSGLCASAASLAIRPAGNAELRIDPCAFVGRGGAVIETTGEGLRLTPARRQENRMWTQALYAPVPKPPKVAKPKTSVAESEPASETTPSGKAPAAELPASGAPSP
jgi:competence protein ComEC